MTTPIVMRPTRKNTCAPPLHASKPSASAKSAEVKSAAAKSAADDDKSLKAQLRKLTEEHAILRERSLRTTNALASAAHDLKTPLAIMNGYVELLQSEKLGALNPRQRDILGDMQSSGQRLQTFIQDFLSYSVLETGELRLRYELADLNACLSEVCRMWSPRFQDRGLALYFLPNEKLSNFEFDSAKIQRVVSNLLENASKFTPAGGTVWLHAEPYMWERRSASASAASAAGGDRRRQAITHPNSAKISVADTGPGIPPEYHIEVFDDFFRLPQTESQHEGMGLGLAIARRLVNGMGGKIWVESENGGGCKFSFIVPLKPAVANTASAKDNKITPGKVTGVTAGVDTGKA